jgi:hypothetical protein
MKIAALCVVALVAAAAPEIARGRGGSQRG